MPSAGHDRPLIALPAGTRGLTAFALALGTFMQVLDTTIANVSLPTIAGNLGVSPDQGTWVITSFAVAERHLGAADRLADAAATAWSARSWRRSRCSRSPRSCAASPGASSR